MAVALVNEGNRIRKIETNIILRGEKRGHLRLFKDGFDKQYGKKTDLPSLSGHCIE